MPRTKRSAEEKLEYYKKKIRKYEKCPDPDPQDTAEISDNGWGFYDSDEPSDAVVVYPDQEVDVDDSDSSDESQLTSIAGAEAVADPTDTQVPINSDSSKEPEKQDESTPENPALVLDPELLKALGEATDATPEFGEKIHDNLAQLWLPLLKKGLAKEPKEKIMKEYLVPENCKLLQAPKLNAEITAAISDLSRNRDKKIALSQQQLGVGITAINRAMTILLNSDDKIKAIKCLSDGCRLLCDLHHQQGDCRTKLITPGLDKSFCQVIQDLERDETLFGKKLSEQIKASKAITRQGLQIKKFNTGPKPTTSQTAASRPAISSGNWASHPRSANRGGRGGSRRGGPAHSAPRAPPPPARSPHPPPTKPRAPPTQRR